MTTETTSLEWRNEQLRRVCTPLPGKKAYDNVRPINIPGCFDGQTLYESLAQMHPHVGDDLWDEWFSLGHIREGDVSAKKHQRVRGGSQYQHIFPNTVEPDVNSDIEIIHEEDSFIAIRKPAPLPVHPCGRFNLNSMTSLLGKVYPPNHLRLVHRLDANTTGVMLIARSRDAATNLRNQFDTSQVTKRYLARCDGKLAEAVVSCEHPIGKETGQGGSRRVDKDGLPAKTVFNSLETFNDGTSLCEALPETGRTHQIRIHLWSMGMPVLGDPAYLKDGVVAPTQTLDVQDPPMCLHASRLSFAHPTTGKPLTIESPDPPWVRCP